MTIIFMSCMLNQVRAYTLKRCMAFVVPRKMHVRTCMYDANNANGHWCVSVNYYVEHRSNNKLFEVSSGACMVRLTLCVSHFGCECSVRDWDNNNQSSLNHLSNEDHTRNNDLFYRRVENEIALQHRPMFVCLKNDSTGIFANEQSPSILRRESFAFEFSHKFFFGCRSYICFECGGETVCTEKKKKTIEVGNIQERWPNDDLW